MGYNLHHRPEKYLGLEKILETIQDLDYGEAYEIKDIPTNYLPRLRYLLYEWMYQNQVKKFYRIRTLDKHLHITKVGVPSSIRGEVIKEGLSEGCAEILKRMIGEEEPLEYLRKEKDKGNITQEEFAEILGKFGEVMI